MRVTRIVYAVAATGPGRDLFSALSQLRLMPGDSQDGVHQPGQALVPDHHDDHQRESSSFFVFYAKRWRRPSRFVPIAGLEAVSEAVGRATEMGKPVLFVPGILDINDIQTVAGITVLANVAQAPRPSYDAQLKVPTAQVAGHDDRPRDGARPPTSAKVGPMPTTRTTSTTSRTSSSATPPACRA